MWSAEERAQDLSERDYNLAIHQLRSGPPSPETRDLVVKLVAAHPNTARIRILSVELQFAESLRLRGQDEEYTAIVVEGAALRALSEITMLDGIAPRTRMSAYRLAGWIYTTQRDWENAEASFRDARQFDGEDPDLAAAHAQALVGYAETSVSAEEREDLVLRARRILDVLRDGELPAEMRADLSKRLSSMESE
jgi:hypothetical protein